MAEVKEELKESIQLSGWMRSIAIISGIIAIIAAIVVIAYPAIGLRTIAVTLGIGLLLIGIDRLATGISGRPYRPATQKKGVPA